MEEDVLRADSVKRYGRKKRRTIPFPLSSNNKLINENDHEHAISYVEGGKYNGAKATINLWNPRIEQPDESSLSQLWISSGSNKNDDYNSIEAGRQASPQIYGDSKARLFVYWTGDGHHGTGCYNLMCKGFVQINHRIALGSTFLRYSDYDGSQYDITISILKEPEPGNESNNKNWWLLFGDHEIGYWPSDLFTHLVDSASKIEWGGEVVNKKPNGVHTSTQMGSGHFAEEGYGKASFFKNIQIVDGSYTLISPQGIKTRTDQSSCYNLHNYQNEKWGNYFYYGGPRKNDKCP